MKRHRHIRRRLVGALAAFVVFCTTYALILPAVTLSGETHCGREEHTHTEDCYKSEDWLCGLEEQPATEGHVHDQTCWQAQETLICGQEESELHAHDATCYQTEQVLICGQEETAGTEGHTHTDDCHKSSEPLCGKEEHTHTRQCQSDPAAVETEEDWKKSIPTDLKEEVRERVLQVAESQLGYRESEKNFRVNEDGTEDGFTRYGEWAGDRYGDWNNAFTGFVLKYAQADGGFNRDINQWIVEQSQNLNTAYETAEPGHIVFYQDDEGQRKSGILESYDAKSQKARIYAGDVEKSVNKIDRTAAQMIGTLQVSDKNTAGTTTEEADSAAGPAEENPEDAEPGEQENGKVIIHGPVDVQTGDDAVLEAEVQGISPETELQYQWQYSMDGNSWTNLEGQQDRKLLVSINEENIDWIYRVEVTKKSKKQTGVGPAGALPKLTMGLTVNLQSTTDSEDSQDGALYATFEFNAVEKVQSSVTTEPGGAYIQIEKGWTSPHDSISEVEVGIYKKIPNSGADGSNKGDLIETITLKASENWMKYWPLPAGYTNADEFVIEEKAPAGWSPLYTDFGAHWYLPEASSLQNGQKYIITDNSGEYCLQLEDGQLKPYPINGSDLPQSVYWTADSYDRLYQSSGGNTYYLAIDSSGATVGSGNDSGTRFSYDRSTYGLYFESGSWPLPSFPGFPIERIALIYGESGFSVTKQNPGNSRVKLYAVQEGIKPGKSRRVLITNTPTYSSGSQGGTGDDVLANGFPISKSIDYLGDNEGSNNDQLNQYQLKLSAGPIAGDAAATPVNVLYVFDNSNSMDDSSRRSNANKAVTESWNEIHELNHDSQMAVVTFGTYSEVFQNWTSNYSNTVAKYKNEYHGGTNYSAALRKAGELIADLDNRYPVFMIFLTDGAATYAGNCNSNGDRTTCDAGNGSNTNNSEVVSLTIKAIEDFRMSHPNVNVSVVGLDHSDNNGYFTRLATANQIYNADTTTIVSQMRAIIAGPSITNGKIVDTLSENVQFSSSPNVRLLAVDKSTGQSQQMWPKTNDGFTLTKLDGKTEGYNEIFAGVSGEPVTWNKQDKTIQAVFGPNWKMNTRYEYVLEFDVEVTETAYGKFKASGYTDTGDSNTDHGEYVTSSLQPGFFSNVSGEDTSAFTFTYNEKEYKRPYLRPVVQIQKRVVLSKVDGKDQSKKLPDAEFTLYKDGGAQIPGTDFTGTVVSEGLRTGSDGTVMLPAGLEAGTYYLQETKAPAGYLASSTIWKLNISNKLTAEGEGITLDNGGESTLKENPLLLKFGLTVSNTAGKPLPDTGGSGTQLLTSAGAAMIAGSLLVYGYKKRLRGKERRFK